jgi:hypothetical protein
LQSCVENLREARRLERGGREKDRETPVDVLWEAKRRRTHVNSGDHHSVIAVFDHKEHVVASSEIIFALEEKRSNSASSAFLFR